MAFSVVTARGNQEHFRREFQRALTKCVAKGFSVEECFGAVWEETLEQTELPESQQAKLYDQLIDWAKRLTVER
ncbi:MAG: hypothetical protein HY735_26865 [Verrucomicrobia bacterium]|nr:hypothetical protein [Verrucomicrobiota bacterium]